MEDHFNDIAVLPFKKISRKKNLRQKIIPSLTPGSSKKMKDEPGNSHETKIGFDKWIMPPEAEGYIKCPRHDFL